MVRTLKEIIEEEIADYDLAIKANKAKLDENFLYNFEWGCAESVYKDTLERNILTGLVDFISAEPERAVEWLTHNIQDIKRNILKGSFIGTSTSVYSNMCYTYKKEVDCKLLSRYEVYLKSITSKNLPII